MKLCVSSYSFSGLVKTGKVTQLECIELAKKIGFDGFEIAGLNVPENMDKKEYAKLIAEECKKQGMTTVNYTIGADFLYGSNGDLNAEVARLKEELDIAEILGVSGMRHDATKGYSSEDRKQRGFEQALPQIVEGCREVTEYGAKKGIRTMIENHGFFCQESKRVEKIVNKVANKNFGLLVDIGNFLCADEQPEQAVARVAPYAFHVHAKDFHIKSGNNIAPQNAFFTTRANNYLRGAIVGHGDVPVFQCLSILNKNGYDGFVSIEFEGIEETKMAIEYGYNTLKHMLSLL